MEFRVSHKRRILVGKTSYTGETTIDIEYNAVHLSMAVDDFQRSVSKIIFLAHFTNKALTKTHLARISLEAENFRGYYGKQL